MSASSTRTPVRRRWLQVIGSLAVMGIGAGMVSAQAQGSYPDKPIRMVVAFPPGGPTDVLARILAQGLSKDLGQNVVVENRPGAGGNIAAESVAQAAADGYTLLYNSSSIAISPALFDRPDLDPGKIFTPVASVANVPLVLIVHPGVKAQTPEAFVAQLKAEPGSLNMGSSGNGTIDHLTGALFAEQTGTEFAHIPYRGNAAALPDLLSGRIDFMMSGSLNAFLPYVQEGKVRALAVTTAERVDVLPDVPTLAETVAPGFDSGTWQGIVGPAGMPPAVVERLNAAVNRLLQDPAVLASLAVQGAEATPDTAAGYGELLQREYQRWSEVIEATGAQAS